MEIVIKGSGETVVRFIDRDGKTLLQERIRVSGSPKVEAKREVSLVVNTISGERLVSPVLVRQGDKQEVTFSGEKPAAYARRRCQEIGCSQSTADDAERGCAHGLPSRALRLSGVSGR